MSEAVLDFLYLLAEVSIATVALSGITMVLAVTNLSLTEQRASLIAVQLRMAFVVTAFAIFPLLLTHYDLSEEKLWFASSIGYVVGVSLNLLCSFVSPTTFSKLPKNAGRLVTITAVCAIGLLTFNLWLAQPWPYLTQLCVGWSSSTLLFLSFIHEVLSNESVSADGT